MILYIPLPLLWRVKIELRRYDIDYDPTAFLENTNEYNRNILFGLWLCTGIFIVVATIVRCVICLGDAESINTGTIWSIRETVREPPHPLSKSRERNSNLLLN